MPTHTIHYRSPTSNSLTLRLPLCTPSAILLSRLAVQKLDRPIWCVNTEGSFRYDFPPPFYAAIPIIIGIDHHYCHRERESNYRALLAHTHSHRHRLRSIKTSLPTVLWNEVLFLWPPTNVRRHERDDRRTPSHRQVVLDLAEAVAERPNLHHKNSTHHGSESPATPMAVRSVSNLSRDGEPAHTREP